MATSRLAPQVHPNLLARMQEARARTDALFEVLPPNSLYERPIPERNRLIFYLGHLEAFDGNLLRPALGLESEEADLDLLFAFGIDPVGGGLPTDTPADWPTIERVREYGRGVRQALDEALNGSRASQCASPEMADGTLLHVAVEHRLMHRETLAYLLHDLPVEKKMAHAAPAPDHRRAPQQRQVTIPAGVATLGQPNENTFGWDNEFKAHSVEVPEFSIDIFPVTNAEFLKFVAAGGYVDSRYWRPEDWEWKSGAALEHPHLWLRKSGSSHGLPEDRWEYRAMFGRIPLPLSWPVYVSHAEASAYCRWAGKRLPSEAQWHRAAYGAPDESEGSYPWGEAAPDLARGNFHFESWDATPVDAHRQGASAFGLFDLLGNGWEWTSTLFAPFPDFRAAWYYPGYSANFFDGKHFVMKGGSPQTDRSMLRRSFRNWFQPRYSYVYATFRCVEE